MLAKGNFYLFISFLSEMIIQNKYLQYIHYALIRLSCLSITSWRREGIELYHFGSEFPIILYQISHASFQTSSLVLRVVFFSYNLPRRELQEFSIRFKSGSVLVAFSDEYCCFGITMQSLSICAHLHHHQWKLLPPPLQLRIARYQVSF